ncbi:hypothetical protein Tco_0532044 [Tanacetum coccineum]
MNPTFRYTGSLVGNHKSYNLLTLKATLGIVDSLDGTERGYQGRCLDTPNAPKPKPATLKPKLKSVQSLTPAEKEAANIMQALKESKKTSKRQQVLEAQVKELVLYQGFPMSPQSSLLPQMKELVLNQGFPIRKRNNDEDDETESDEDEIYKYKIRVRKDKDVEMKNAEVEDFKKAELPPTRSSLSVSLGFGDQFLKLSSNNSLVSIVKDNTDADINSLLEVKIQSEVPLIQSPSVLRVPVSVISKPTVLTPVQETSLVAPITTLPLPSVSTTPLVSQQTTTPIPSPPITTDAPIITSVVLESDALSVTPPSPPRLPATTPSSHHHDHIYLPIVIISNPTSSPPQPRTTIGCVWFLKQHQGCVWIWVQHHKGALGLTKTPKGELGLWSA